MAINRALQELREYGATLLAEEGAGSAAPASPQVRSGLSPRLLRVALPAMVLAVFGNIGLAAAADSAVPGDLLYPVDRAYESISAVFGIDSDTAAERISESSVLLAQGRFSTAVEMIAVSAAAAGDSVDDRIRQVGAELALADTASADREDLHRSVAALSSTVATMTASGDDPTLWIDTIDASSDAIIDVAAGLPFDPEGQSDSFVPPGQDDGFTPPGQDEGSLPPGQDDEFTPPGQDEDRTPPGQNEDRTPPGQNEDRTPPGQNEDRTPPGQDKDTTPPGQGDTDKGSRQ